MKGSLTVGREAKCEMVLDDPKVSRHHGTFYVQDDRLYYRDHNSTNGSFVNGERIVEYELKLGDTIKIGSTEFAIAEENDFRTINFVASDSMVTGIVDTTAVRADALANKFAQIFDYYKEHTPEISEAERYELVRTQRMLNGLKTLFAISQSMTRIVTMEELLKMIGDKLFELFAGAENMAILLNDEDKKQLVLRQARTREEGKDPVLNISRTVLDQALARRSTLIANDAATDERLSSSASIIGFAVKSVMCAPLISGERVLGAIYLDNRQEAANYDELDAELVTAFANQCAVAIENAFLCDSLQKHYHQTLQALVNAIEAKDSYTMGHTARVSKYSVGIGRFYGLDPKRLERLKLAADLHDIGKIGIKEGIINKAGKLTDTEYVTIKDHVEMGEKILKPISYLQDILPHIRSHHEKWDGTGYPDGLKEEQIPVEGRILALADALDAMTSQRSYNKPMTHEQALKKIIEVRGRHFDPVVVDAYEKYVLEVLLKEAGPTTDAAASTDDPLFPPTIKQGEKK